MEKMEKPCLEEPKTNQPNKNKTKNPPRERTVKGWAPLQHRPHCPISSVSQGPQCPPAFWLPQPLSVLRASCLLQPTRLFPQKLVFHHSLLSCLDATSSLLFLPPLLPCALQEGLPQLTRPWSSRHSASCHRNSLSPSQFSPAWALFLLLSVCPLTSTTPTFGKFLF